MDSAGTTDKAEFPGSPSPEGVVLSRDGRTALFFLSAPEERAVEIAELLLGHGVDPKFRDADGLTAADAAAKSGFEDVAELLRGTA